MTVKTRKLKETGLDDELKKEILIVAQRSWKKGVILNTFEKEIDFDNDRIRKVVYNLVNKGNLYTEMVPVDPTVPLLYHLEKRYFWTDCLENRREK